MLNLNCRNRLNLMFFQSLWFAAVLGRESLLWLLVLLLTAHALVCTNRKTGLKVMLLCAGLGSGVDIVLTLTGIFVFSPPPTVLPIPIWLTALWLGFAATLRHSLSYLLLTRRLIRRATQRRQFWDAGSNDAHVLAFFERA